MNKALRIAVTLLVACGICVTLTTPTTRASAATNVNNFAITDYQIDYYLGKDASNHSTLKTVESITADFPASNQNHGIERAIPTSYDGHKTNLQITSVTAPGRGAQHYSTSTDNGNLVVRIGDANTYVHGPHTYEITYTQQEVTKYYSDTDRDEFYWDTNGTEWAVPITSLAVRLHIDPSLRYALTDNQACYVGSAGSADKCTLTATSDGYTASTNDLQPHQNITVAIGFAPKTFAAHIMTAGERFAAIWALSLFVIAPVALTLCIWFMVRYTRRSNRSSETQAIIPEYLPPTDISVSSAAMIMDKTNRSLSAQLIDFAVRQYIMIYQTSEKSWLRPAQYELELIKDTTDLKIEEREVLQALFDTTTPGKHLDMTTIKNNSAVGMQLRATGVALTARIAGEYGLRAKSPTESAWFKRAAIITGIGAVITLSPWLAIAAATALVCGIILKPFTDKGLALVRYLKGLELYIKVAETERIRMLQSPEGAEKIGAPIDANNHRQLIKLYERVLPYAVLFGQEKEWNKRLALYYETAGIQPDWFDGNATVFNAVALSSALNDFTSTASYTGASISTSGGSGGGGSSGGGGGGGGGGGW